MTMKHILAPALWWDRLLASDPALDRLRLAARAAVSAGLATLVLSTLARWTHQPVTTALVGASVAMNSALAVSDPDPRQQRLTLLLLPLPAALALLLGSLAAPHQWLGPATFVGVVFAAVYVRRFGPRGTALGMIAFFTFFFALFFQATLAQVPWMVGSAVVATAIAAAVRFWLFPERPDRLLRHSVDAFRRAVALVLDALKLAAEAPAWTEREERSVRRPLTRLNDAALELEALVERASPEVLEPGLSRGELRERLFELELATQRVQGAVRQVVETRSLPAGVRASVRRVLSWARVAVRSGDAPAAERARQELVVARRLLGDAPDEDSAHALVRLEVTVRDLLAAAAWTWRPVLGTPPLVGMSGAVHAPAPAGSERQVQGPAAETPAAATPPPPTEGCVPPHARPSRRHSRRRSPSSRGSGCPASGGTGLSSPPSSCSRRGGRWGRH